MVMWRGRKVKGFYTTVVLMAILAAFKNGIQLAVSGVNFRQLLTIINRHRNHTQRIHKKTFKPQTKMAGFSDRVQ